MSDFFSAALPFIIMGICLAIICANLKKEKKTYAAEGMCIGMCFGAGLSAIFKINMATGISLGMLIGEAIGILIEKK